MDAMKISEAIRISFPGREREGEEVVVELVGTRGMKAKGCACFLTPLLKDSIDPNEFYIDTHRSCDLTTAQCATRNSINKHIPYDSQSNIIFLFDNALKLDIF